jgi:transcriptional repressor NrdR
MHCPFCPTEETKVVDSRLVADGSQVRRRRQCIECSERFTTYEAFELLMPRVIKSNGNREPFDQEKLRSGLLKSLEKRPVSIEKIEAELDRIKQSLMSIGEREIKSIQIGEAVMDALNRLDKVAYVRFASVYKDFKDLNEFQNEINRIQDLVD